MDDVDPSILDTNSSELESRIFTLELRNRELELRNSQLTKLCSVLTLISDSVEPHHKMKRVNDYAHLIITKNIENISAITYLATNNEENQEVLALVDH